MAIPLSLPQEYVADVYQNGEAQGGGFALSEIPHPYHDLLPDAKIPIVFVTAKNVNTHRKKVFLHRNQHTEVQTLFLAFLLSVYP